MTRMLLGIVMLAMTAATAADDDDTARLVDRGRYLVQVAACNDCHTPGYIAKNGDVPEALWLLGDSDFGWRGPWGTTYPVNLRRYMQALTPAQWLAVARSFQPRPPMPWFNVKAMTDEDLLAIYWYARSLQPVGEPAREFVPPDREPVTPFALFPG